jgi:riboflavin synthase
VDLAPETLKRTHFRIAKKGYSVNLENALQCSDRNSGHNVQGHVDGVGKIEYVAQEGISLRVKISTRNLSEDRRERGFMNSLIVPKGFIAVDGASLTVCEVNRAEEWFTLMLIPHTQAVLKPWEVDGLVNIELDCFAKYITASLDDYVAPRISSLTLRSNVAEFIAVVSLAVSLVCFVKVFVNN